MEHDALLIIAATRQAVLLYLKSQNQNISSPIRVQCNKQRSNNMPNCHWFGTRNDHAFLLERIFAQQNVDVYELYSRPNHRIRKFTTIDEILDEFNIPYEGGEGRTTLNLMLWVQGAGPEIGIERFALDPAYCNGATWREHVGPMGCVNFYLKRPANQMLDYSETNTLSTARMGAVDGIFTGYNGEIWDMRLTISYSRWLNRQIRKFSVAKLGAISVLPEAAHLWKEGYTFYHWNVNANPEYYRAKSGNA